MVGDACYVSMRAKGQESQAILIPGYVVDARPAADPDSIAITIIMNNNNILKEYLARKLNKHEFGASTPSPISNVSMT